jgi:myo-inositol-1(or 4)-monophosphatase
MPTQNDLEALARGAGEILRAGYLAGVNGQRSKIYMKGEIDLVTETDRLSEAFVISEIRRRFPTHSITAEESGATQADPDYIWYVDPLDGTINFAHGLPIFSVSIAYAEHGRTILGAVYDPIHDEYFSAERGLGAQLNGFPIRISDASELGSSLLVTGFPYDIRTTARNNLDLHAEFSLRSRGVRRLGSAALDLCYLACGRLDGFWELTIQQYDIAAGGLIAEEAGAIVTAVDGVSGYLTPPPSILASTPQVHPQMADVIRAAGIH